MNKLIPLIALILLVAVDARGQSDEESLRLQLYTGCGRIHLLVNVGIEKSEISLTEARVTTTVRSKLRGARIYTSDLAEASAGLIVSIRVLDNAFRYDVALMKEVTDIYGNRGFALTWIVDNIGTHSGRDTGAQFILNAIGEQVDRFIDQYLEVNEDACE
ncbi:MAG: hypothetical protein F4120_10385 [Rhodothermaceae bacterium]|nr:hypothetical protein [Rhodothermaceae bacterium]MXW31670.1 hypothetical protein [Rhodothermaceae bacterium]MYC05402.1 hypothetical protein [Rhodothermaceae bacterium]MYE63081.1 hypothetical protein [Rhodothermaceae bacterium]MYI18006.1 hypothetical protein [Rhodothermaceae bacterium]